MPKILDVLRSFNIWWLFIIRHISRVILAAFVTVSIVISNPCPMEASLFQRPEQVPFENIDLFFQPTIGFSQNWLNGLGIGFGNFIERGFHDGKPGDKLLPGFASGVSTSNVDKKPSSKQCSNNLKQTAYDICVHFLFPLARTFIGIFIVIFPLWITHTTDQAGRR